MMPLTSRTDLGCHALCLIALALAGVLSGTAAGDETPDAYRRILVPADNPAAWPRDGEKFLPVESRDFDSWLAAAKEPPSEAFLAEAEYAARLLGSSLVGGRGRWRVVLRGERPARLTIGDKSLVIHNAKWRDAAQQPAQLGWWHDKEGAPMSYGLSVPRSSELDFAWRLPLGRPTPSALEFPLRLPTAAGTRLTLRLPAEKRPVIQGSVVLESPAGVGKAGKWVLAVDASTAAVLRIENTNSRVEDTATTVSVHKDVHYAITQRGIDMTTSLWLEGREPPLKELPVALPAGVQLVAASAGDQELTWRVTSAEEAKGAAEAVVELPASSPGGPQVVVLQAWAPLAIDEPRPLPRLSTKGTFWTSGTIELAIDESLELRETVPVDCVQTSLPEGEQLRGSGKRLAFDCFSPQATVELAVSHRRVVGRVRMGAALAVGNPGVDGRVVTEVRVDRGSLHTLAAELRPDWSVDAVETVPADALGEWYVKRNRNARSIELQLHRAATPEQSVTIIVSGRMHRAGPLEPLALDSLRLFEWRGLEVERELMRLEAVEPYELESIGELPLSSAGELSDADRRLFDGSVRGRVFDAGGTKTDAAVRLSTLQGTYDAEVQLDTTLVGSQLQQSCRVECRPHGSGIDHVLVYLSEPALQPPRWFDADRQEQLVAERMPSSDPRLGGLPPGGELWLLHLRRLYARPVTITATLTTPWPERRRVPLVSLPDADSQRGRVTVWSEGVELPAIVARRMTPAPLPVQHEVESSPRRGAEPRAVYRYQPSRFYDAGSPLELWLGPPVAERESAPLVARQVDVESFVAADGSGVHRVTYQLENQGASFVATSLPTDVRLESARLDGQTIAELPAGAAAGEVTIRLPPRRRNVVLELDLRSQHPPLTFDRRVSSPLPTSEITVLGGEWTIWLPHEFAVAGDLAADHDGSFAWRRRLFGPLARPQTERPFNPLDADNWNTLWAGLHLTGTKPALAAAESAVNDRTMPTGWRAHHVDFVGGPPSTLAIAHPPATAAWALAIFLVCLLGTPLCRLREVHVVALAAVAAVCALLLPVVHAPLATAAMMGLLLSSLWQWAHQVFGVRRAALVLFAAASANVPTTADAAPQPVTIHRVLVPVDSDGKPAGTKYFVSDQFLRRLLETSREQPIGGTWLVTDMRCRGEFVKRPNQSGLKIGTWNVSFEIDVLTRDTTVELPLIEREADWSETASLDGIPAPIVWDARGEFCSIRVAEPGRYRLSIPFEPRVQEAEGRQQVELSLPPIAGADVRWVSPWPLADLTARGTTLVRRDESTRTVWQGVLDGSGRLTASWADAQAGSLADTNRRVAELLWLRIEPDAVELDARYVLQDGAGWPAEMDLLVDDHWELRPGLRAASPHDVQSLPDGRQLIRLRPPRSTDEGRDVLLSFRLRGTSPLGRHRLPAIGLESVPITQRLLAVSCDSSLECEPSSAVRSATDAVTGFAAAWRGSREAELPQLAWDALKLEVDWHLVVRPRAISSSFREQLSLVAGKDRLRLVYQSDVQPQGADRFRWSLAVPAELAIESIAGDRGGEHVPLDWVRATPNRINVFFANSVPEPYRLQLVGSLPVKSFGRLPLPRITAAQRPLAAQNVSLYRSSDVLAAWQFPAEAPWVEGGASEIPPFDARARFVRAYSIDPATADAARIVVEPNEPVVSGDTLTTLSQASGNWSASLKCNLRVERGELDTLRLRVPATWTGPFSVTPTATTEIIGPSVEGSAATLLVHLAQPMPARNTVQLEIRGPLALADAQAAAVPRVAPLGPHKWRSFLSLPGSLDGDRTAWTQFGIEPAELPRELSESERDTAAAGEIKTYRVVADNFSVMLQPRSARGSSASVRLAETTVHVDQAGRQFSVTRFVIAPQGLGQCTIELPTDERLVRATLDGHPALLRSVDRHHWQVQLGPPHLPQTLEIVSRNVERADGKSRLLELSRPVLMRSDGPIPVEINLWNLRRAGSMGTPRVTDAAIMDPAQLAALRLNRLVGISRTATRPLIESPVVDAYSWFTNWTAQLQAAQQAAKSLQFAPSGAATAVRVTQSAGDPVDEVAARADAWLQQMEEFFGNPEPAVARQVPAQNAFALWRDQEAELVNRFCFISDGSQGRLRVEFEPLGLSAGESRSAVLAAIVALAFAAFWFVRTPAAIEAAQRWPEAVGLMLGLAAWAWLRPSAVGLLLAVVCLCLIVGRLYRERKSPRHDSFKQTNSIPEDSA